MGINSAVCEFNTSVRTHEEKGKRFRNSFDLRFRNSFQIHIAYRDKLYTNEQSLRGKGVGIPFPCVLTEKSTGVNPLNFTTPPLALSSATLQSQSLKTELFKLSHPKPAPAPLHVHHHHYR